MVVFLGFLGVLAWFGVFFCQMLPRILYHTYLLAGKNVVSLVLLTLGSYIGLGVEETNPITTEPFHVPHCHAKVLRVLAPCLLLFGVPSRRENQSTGTLQVI